MSEGSSIPVSVLGSSCIEETNRSHPMAAAEAKARTVLGAKLELAPEDETSHAKEKSSQHGESHFLLMGLWRHGCIGERLQPCLQKGQWVSDPQHLWYTESTPLHGHSSSWPNCHLLHNDAPPPPQQCLEGGGDDLAPYRHDNHQMGLRTS